MGGRRAGAGVRGAAARRGSIAYGRGRGIARADELVAEWEQELRRELPEGAEIFDAHTHLGHDIDGMVGEYDRLIASMDRHGVERANMFCLDEPDRVPAFRAGNERTLAFAERS